MNFEKKIDDKGILEFYFVTEKEEWHSAREAAAVKAQKKAKIDGFRPGKAPINMVKKLYAKEIFDDAAEDVFEKAYRNEVMAELATMRIYDEVGLSVEKVTDDELEFVFKFILMPELELKQYKGLNVSIHQHQVTDDDIDKAIKAEADKNGRWVDVQREAQMGDQVNIDFDGYVENEKFEGGEAKAFDLELGSGRFIPGFEEQVVGMVVGQTKDVIVTFPEEYGVEKLNGKESKFIVTLNSVKYKEVPAIDDDLAIDCGFDSLEAMRQDKLSSLTEETNKHNESVKENSLIDALMVANPVVVYDAILDLEMEKDKKRQEERMKQYQITFEQYLQYIGSTIEKYNEEKRLSLRDDVHTRLIFMAVLDVEKIEATDLEVEAEIEKYAEKQNKKVEEFKKEIGQDDMRYFENMALTYKLLEFLKANNNFVIEE